MGAAVRPRRPQQAFDVDAFLDARERDAAPLDVDELIDRIDSGEQRVRAMPAPPAITPRPTPADVTAQRPSAEIRDEEVTRGIVENLRAARAERAAAPTEAQREFASRFTHNPLGLGLVQAGSTLFAGPVQRALEGVTWLTGSEVSRRLAATLRAHREVAEQAAEGESVPEQVVRGLVRTGVEFTGMRAPFPAVPRAFGTLAERAAFHAGVAGSEFAAYGGLASLLEPTPPSPVHTIEEMSRGAQAGAVLGAAVPTAIEAWHLAVRRAQSLMAGKALAPTNPLVVALRGDPFAVLGLGRYTATPEAVEAAYRDAAQRWHPDVNPEPHAGEVFDLMTKARAVAQAELGARVRRPVPTTAEVPARPEPTPAPVAPEARAAPAPRRAEAPVGEPVPVEPRAPEPRGPAVAPSRRPGIRLPEEGPPPVPPGVEVPEPPSTGEVEQEKLEARLSMMEAAHEQGLRTPQLEATRRRLREIEPEKAEPPIPSGLEAAPIERVRAAAIQLADGTIYEGPIHVDAIDAAQRAGRLDPRTGQLPDFETGFVTTEGRFVTNLEATTIGQRAAQLPAKLPMGRRRAVAQDFAAREPAAAVPETRGKEAERGELRPDLQREPAREPARGVPEAPGERGVGRAGGGNAPAGEGYARAGREPTAPEPAPARGEPRGPAEVRGAGGEGAGVARHPGAEPGGRGGERPELRGTDYRLTDEDAGSLEVGGVKAKAERNVGAIKILKQTEAEGRAATPEEQKILAQYTGWGQLPQAFNLEHEEYGALARELREALTEEEYKAARASTPNAHYTSPVVIRAIWKAMGRLGLKSGRVLEPGAGVGYFLGLAPKGLRFTAVELDAVSGRIMKLLYPRQDVRVAPFEETITPVNFYQGAVGNVPFADVQVFDPEYEKLKLTLHNYFIVKMLDRVEPGGVVGVVTSRFTLDRSDAAAVRAIAARADLLAAIRLPDNAFKKIANTEVVADILFLRRRLPGEKPGGEAFAELGLPKGEKLQAAGYRVNRYFLDHPEMVLGEFSLEGTQYGPAQLTVKAREGKDLAALLEEAIEKLPEGIVQAPAQTTDMREPVAIEAKGQHKDGAYVVEGGRLYRYRKADDKLVLAEKSPGIAEQIKMLVAIREATHEVLRTQLADAPEATQKAARAELNRVYDRFVKKYGPIAKRVVSGKSDRRPNLAAFRDDPDAPLVATLEEPLDEAEESFTKSAIFTKRVIARAEPVSSVKEPGQAVLVSLNQLGRVDLDRVADLLGRTPEEAREDLRGLVYEDPATGRMESADAYLSGNVRKKLVQAKAALKSDKKYAENVKALEEVQPEDLPPSRIKAGLGATWITPEDYAQFVEDLLGKDRWDRVRVSHVASQAEWKIEAPWNVTRSVAATADYGTPDVNAIRLIEDALNQRMTTVTYLDAEGKRHTDKEKTLLARDKQDKIAEVFRDWVWKDPARSTRLHRVYNDTHNNIVPRQFDGRHLTFPGASGTIKLHDHQYSGVYRVLEQRSTLMGIAVGGGKTFINVAASMELKRLGLARKPLHIVKNSMLTQYARDFLRLYPAARLLVMSKEEVTPANRKAITARIATGDWDAIITTHTSFGKIPVSVKLEREFIEEERSVLVQGIMEAKQARNRDVTKLLEKAKKRLEVRIKKLENRAAKDDFLPFDELGVDALFVDEAQAFKNLGAMTKMRNIPLSEPRQKALDLHIKTRFLHRIGGRIVFSTATPVANTLTEMYTLEQYLMPELLAEQGIEHFDAWAAQFAEAYQVMEAAPDGSGYRTGTRFRFKNVPVLSQALHSISDVRTAEDLKLVRPEVEGGKPMVLTAAPSPELRAYIRALVARSEAIRSGQVDPTVDNMLKVTGDGRAAALDMRLVDATQPDNPASKVNVAVDRIFQEWEAGKKDRLTQAVFLDISTPHPGEFNVYEDMRAKLIARGVPAEEIAFIQNFDTDDAKFRLFRRVREGRVRILFGSSETMGVGVNVQTKLKVAHHIDAPWRPDQLEQRDGRIVRQGNDNKSVRILRYTTEGSFDVYFWQTLERKAQTIDALTHAREGVDELEDTDSRALNYAEVKAITSGNPLVMEKATVDAEVIKLGRLAAAHRDRLFRVHQTLAQLPERTARLKEVEEHAAIDAGRLRDVKGEKFIVEIENKTYTDRAEAGKALLAAAGAVVKSGSTESQLVGKFAGLNLEVRAGGIGGKVFVALIGRGEYDSELSLGASPQGITQVLEYLPKRVELQRKAAEDERDVQEKRKGDLERLAGEPFEGQEELERLRKRQVEINAALDLSKTDKQAETADQAEEPQPIPEIGTEEAGDETTPSEIEESVQRDAGTSDERPAPALPPKISAQARRLLLAQLGPEAADLSEPEVIAEAVRRGILDTGDDLRQAEAGFLFAGEQREAEDIAEAGEKGLPHIFVEKAPVGLGFIQNYLMPPSWGMKRLLHSKRPDLRRVGSIGLRIVTTGQDATLENSRLADGYEERLQHRIAGLSKAELESFTALVDDERYVSAKDLPAGTPGNIMRAFEDHRSASRDHWKAMGELDAFLLRGRSKAILNAALTEWPVGTPAPDFDTTPVNRRAVQRAADLAGIPDDPVTREDWERLYQKARMMRKRMQRPVFMDSPDLRRIFGQLRGEGGILAHFPHVFKGEWVVRAGAQTARFVDRLEAAEYAKSLIESGYPQDILVQRDAYVPDYSTYLSRARWIALKERIAKEAAAESAVVSRALGEAKVKIQPRKRFFAHGQAREVNLQTFEKDYLSAMRTYHFRLARYLAFTKFRKLALDLRDTMPADGGWRDWADEYIADVQGVPGRLTESINNSLIAMTGGRLGPIPMQRAAGRWQHTMSIFYLGYSIPSAMLQIGQYAYNVVPSFERDGNKWAWTGLQKLLEGSPESMEVLDKVGIKFQHPKYMLSEFEPHGEAHGWKRWFAPMFMFNRSEYIVRSATALGHYYEQLSKGAGVESATARGREKSLETQFDYTLADAPKVMRNPIGRAFFQFKAFELNELMFAENIFRWGNPKQKASFLFWLLALGGISALAQFPVVVAVDWLLGKSHLIKDPEGNPVSPMEAFYEWADEPDASFMRKAAFYGIYGLAGVDFTYRLAFGGNMTLSAGIPVEEVRRLVAMLKSRTHTERMYAIRRLAPSAAARLLKAYEMSQTGVARDAYGNVVQESVTTSGIVKTAVGFRDIGESARSHATERRRRASQAYRDARAMWLDRAAAAFRADEDVDVVIEQAEREGIEFDLKDVEDYVERRDRSREEREFRAMPRPLREGLFTAEEQERYEPPRRRLARPRP